MFLCQSSSTMEIIPLSGGQNSSESFIFDPLPIEIQNHILSYTNFETIKSVRSLNKALHKKFNTISIEKIPYFHITTPISHQAFLEHFSWINKSKQYLEAGCKAEDLVNKCDSENMEKTVQQLVSLKEQFPILAEYAWYPKSHYQGLFCGPGLRSLVGEAMWQKKYALAEALLHNGFLPGYTRITEKAGNVGIKFFDVETLLNNNNSDNPGEFKEKMKCLIKTERFNLNTKQDALIQRLFYTKNTHTSLLEHLKMPYWYLLRDYNGNTIAHRMINLPSNDINSVLQNQSIDWEAKNYMNFTPLDMISSDQEEILNLILNTKYDKPISFDQKISVLFEAINKKKINLIKVLLQHISVFEENGNPIEYQNNNFFDRLICKDFIDNTCSLNTFAQESWYKFVKTLFEEIGKKKNGKKHLILFFQKDESKKFIQFACQIYNPEIKFLLADMGIEKKGIQDTWEKNGGSFFPGTKDKYIEFENYTPKKIVIEPDIPPADQSSLGDHSTNTKQSEQVIPENNDTQKATPSRRLNPIAAFFQSLRNRLSYFFTPTTATSFLSRAYAYITTIFS